MLIHVHVHCNYVIVCNKYATGTHTCIYNHVYTVLIFSVQSQDQSAAFSQERDGWKRDRDGLLAEIQRLKSFPAPQYTQSPTNLALRQNETTPIRHTPSQSPDAENLDFDMAKVHACSYRLLVQYVCIGENQPVPKKHLTNNATITYIL